MFPEEQLMLWCAELLLSLLVFAITFPSPVRRFTRLRQLITDVFYTWSTACFVLLFFGYAGRFFANFEPGTLAAWALAVPPDWAECGPDGCRMGPGPAGPAALGEVRFSNLPALGKVHGVG